MSRLFYWSIYGGSLFLSVMLIAASVMAVFGIVPFRSVPPVLAAGYDRSALASGDLPYGSIEGRRPDDLEGTAGWHAVWQARSQAAGTVPEPAGHDDGRAKPEIEPAAPETAPDRGAQRPAPADRPSIPRAQRRDRSTAGAPLATDVAPASVPPDRPIGDDHEPGVAPVVVAGLWPQIQPETAPAPTPEPPIDSDPDDDEEKVPEVEDGGAPGQEVPHGPLRLSLVPGHEEVAPGDLVSVRVVLSEADSVSSVPFHVRFNSEVLEYVGAQSGPAITSSPVEPILLAAVNPARPDDLAVGLALVRSSGRFSGSGTVVVLDFRALQAGQSDLLLERASVRDTNSRPLTVLIENSALSVR